jgi:hypothetical protein
MPSTFTASHHRLALAAGFAAAVSAAGGLAPDRVRTLGGSPPQCQPADTVLSIDRPPDRAVVGETPFVEGTFAAPRRDVWAIVHPTLIATYFVQQSAPIHANCTWRIQVHIGRPGQIDVGKHFEVMTVISPRAPLQVGRQLPGWPQARYQSTVIEVVRGR